MEGSIKRIALGDRKVCVEDVSGISGPGYATLNDPFFLFPSFFLAAFFLFADRGLIGEADEEGEDLPDAFEADLSLPLPPSLSFSFSFPFSFSFSGLNSRQSLLLFPSEGVPSLLLLFNTSERNVQSVVSNH